MRASAALLVLTFVAWSVVAAKKPNPKKVLPPAESHGTAISRYGCDRQFVQYMPSDANRTAVWSLIVWAEYGKDHKRYWKKTYGTYQIAMTGEVQSSGESAGSGAAIGPIASESFDFGPMDKGCAEWGQEMQSTFKIKPDGSAITR